ncbi:hypothetical protein ACS0TY_008273 [Phlomoides rotata]
MFLQKGSYSTFVELHIEQGPILEEEEISIGVVTAIAAPASIKVVFERWPCWRCSNAQEVKVLYSGCV